MDPDIVAAMDDDFDFEDPDNALDDDFIIKAMGEEGEGEGEEGWETDDDDSERMGGGRSDDEEGDQVKSIYLRMVGDMIFCRDADPNSFDPDPDPAF